MKLVCDHTDAHSVGIIYEDEHYYWHFIQLNVPEPNLLMGFYQHAKEDVTTIDHRFCAIRGRSTTAREIPGRPDLLHELRRRPLEVIMELLL